MGSYLGRIATVQIATPMFHVCLTSGMVVRGLAGKRNELPIIDVLCLFEMFSCTDSTAKGMSELSQKSVPSFLVPDLELTRKRVNPRIRPNCSANAPLRAPRGSRDAPAVPKVDCIAG